MVVAWRSILAAAAPMLAAAPVRPRIYAISVGLKWAECHWNMLESSIALTRRRGSLSAGGACDSSPVMRGRRNYHDSRQSTIAVGVPCAGA